MSSTFIILLSGGLDSTVSAYAACQNHKRGEALFLDYGQKARKRELAAVKKITRSLDLGLRVIELPFLREITSTALVMNDQVIPQIKMSKLDDRNETQKSAQAVWVPNRNGLFLNIAASLAEGLGIPEIVVGFNSEEAVTFPDNSANFLARAEQFFEFSTLSHPQVSAPTIGMNKTEIVQFGQKLKVDWESFWSCYHDQKKMCGRCESCLRAMRAFQNRELWESVQHRFA